ncbi:MAG TPA: alpha/beta hydrolase [Mycobacterium sp.]|nr:alpha/beta hydrolase [Mycobacterium sp.]
MVERYSAWLGAAIVTAGVAAAMVTGTAVASADAPPGSDTNQTTSSESTKPSENKADSDNNVAGTPRPNPVDEKPKDEATDDATGPEDVDDETADEEPSVEQPRVEPTTEKRSDTAEKLADQQLKPVVKEQKPAANPPAEQDAEEPALEEATKATASIETPVEPVAAIVPIARTDKTVAAAETAAVAFAAPADAVITSTAGAPPFSGLLSAIGTIVFNLYGLATRLFGGPPILPPNSSVTVHSSTLVLGCGCDVGDTIEVPADWYIPEGAEENPPDRLIYLQHGFLASGPWYSHTAAALAEQTNSIVVAPSITSNFLAADACWLGAPPMHQAIANLFTDGNTALAESALAAGYSGPIPDRVVLIGHSLGGGAVAGAAGHMTADRLAGVVMLDGVGLDDTMAASLDDVPDSIPVYQLAAPKYFWNQFGVGTDALREARPDGFIGVTLVGGSHVDSMRGGNPLIQFSQQLVSGFSTPENVAAAQIVMVGWVNDMFAPGDEDEGIYLDPGEQFVLDTPAGKATLVDLPNSLTKPFLFNFLQPFVALGNGFFTFEPTCVAESMSASGTCQGSMAA